MNISYKISVELFSSNVIPHTLIYYVFRTRNEFSMSLRFRYNNYSVKLKLMLLIKGAYYFQISLFITCSAYLAEISLLITLALRLIWSPASYDALHTKEQPHATSLLAQCYNGHFPRTQCQFTLCPTFDYTVSNFPFLY